ncbi:hypothetical protein CC78DRAFT_532346 [Lojkania enalia]|uniref:CFEM domain-containing protein n=1 Tax=Lojkania enalia TaxID=147567 RepID=A0A9P4KBL1_9PLEO|nr:hypothetical protein CC78DRAFT_532346 [Didymosphaeria enalia]
MRFPLAAAVAALNAVVLGQDLLGQIPRCAQLCFGTDYGECQGFDIGCICDSEDLIHKVSCCVFATCSIADRNTTIEFASNLCAANGVTVNTNPSCPSTSSAAPTATSSGTASSETTVVSGVANPSSTAAAGIHTAAAGMGVGLAMAGILAAL